MTKLKTLVNVAKCSVGCVPLNLGLTVKPKYLWFETTDHCNSKCTTCNIWKKKPTTAKDLVDGNSLRRCFNDPLMSDIKYVLNSGGEATLSNLEDILLFENSYFPKATLQISSNGLLPEHLATIVQYAMGIGVKHLDVGLSIDGVGRAHDLVRGVEGNFEKLEYCLELLADLKLKYPDRIFLSMGSTLTDVTAQEASKLYDYSKKVDVPFMWHWFNTGSFYENNEVPNSVGVYSVIHDYPAHNLYMDSWRQSLVTGKIPKFKCLALKTFLAIKCNGDVIPCLSRWSEPIGNIKHQKISEIWKSKQAQEERLKIQGCPGCLNSWGWSWSVNETYYPILADVIKRKIKL